MSPERWQQLKQILQSALERYPAQRFAFLRQACAGNAELRKEVESLVSSHDQAGNSIEVMAVEAASEMLGDDRTGRGHVRDGHRPASSRRRDCERDNRFHFVSPAEAQPGRSGHQLPNHPSQNFALAEFAISFR